MSGTVNAAKMRVVWQCMATLLLTKKLPIVCVQPRAEYLQKAFDFAIGCRYFVTSEPAEVACRAFEDTKYQQINHLLDVIKSQAKGIGQRHPTVYNDVDDIASSAMQKVEERIQEFDPDRRPIHSYTRPYVEYTAMSFAARNRRNRKQVTFTDLSKEDFLATLLEPVRAKSDILSPFYTEQLLDYYNTIIIRSKILGIDVDQDRLRDYVILMGKECDDCDIATGLGMDIRNFRNWRSKMSTRGLWGSTEHMVRHYERLIQRGKDRSIDVDPDRLKTYLFMLDNGFNYNDIAAELNISVLNLHKWLSAMQTAGLWE